MPRFIDTLRSELLALYPEREARAIANAIIEAVTGWTPTVLATHPEYQPDSVQQQQLQQMLFRLKRCDPLQYVLGETFFCGLLLHCDHRALIPRPETAELVEWLVQYIPPHATILDIGTGTGCIAVAIAKLLPTAKVAACDISPNALALALENAALNRVHIDFFQADILTTTSLINKYDIIISNPPYVTASERADMEANVLHYEPPQALFVPDNNPLLFYRVIARLARTALYTNGMLFFEINQRFGKEVTTLLREEGFVDITLRRDLSGNDRMVCGKMK